MSKVEIEINPRGLRNLFRDAAIQGACIEVANNVVENTGFKEGYNVSAWTGPHRAGATVWCNSEEAIKDNLENNTMLKALGAAAPADKIVTKN